VPKATASVKQEHEGTRGRQDQRDESSPSHFSDKAKTITRKGGHKREADIIEVEIAGQEG